jgi:hypothetical protein
LTGTVEGKADQRQTSINAAPSPVKPKRHVMHLDKQNALLRLLRLMTQAEREAFLTDYDISDTESDASILASIGRLPRYEAVRAFLRAADATLLVLRDVFEILESFGIATRTTGCVFVLSNPANREERTELAFSQQTVGAVCNWSRRNKWNHGCASLSQLRSTWTRFHLDWQSLLRRARPKRERGDIDLIATVTRRQMTYEPDQFSVDYDAARVLRHFADRVQQMAHSLTEIPDAKRPRELTDILRDARNLSSGIDVILAEVHERSSPSRHKTPEPPDMRVIERYTSPRFVKDFDKCIEDIYSLSDLVHGEDVMDMLQINIWSGRPQLYEIWVLTTLCRWIRGRGYSVKLLKIEHSGDTSPFRWNLSYANESTPCAIVGHRDGSDQFLFYQLHRSSGDMPDISLLEDRNPSSPPVWSVDPKHSEKGRYKLPTYRATATRYRDSFGAKCSLVVEYFERSELGGPNPTEFGPRAKLIRDCRPGGNGLPILFSELAEFHPPISTVLICIDCSESFSSERQSAIVSLLASPANDERSLMRECICFAGSALIFDRLDTLSAARKDAFVIPTGLKSGTAAGPLFSAIEVLGARVRISEVVLLTDGVFDDAPIEDVIDRIARDLHAKVTVVGT